MSMRLDVYASFQLSLLPVATSCLVLKQFIHNSLQTSTTRRTIDITTVPVCFCSACEFIASIICGQGTNYLVECSVGIEPSPPEDTNALHGPAASSLALAPLRTCYSLSPLPELPEQPCSQVQNSKQPHNGPLHKCLKYRGNNNAKPHYELLEALQAFGSSPRSLSGASELEKRKLCCAQQAMATCLQGAAARAIVFPMARNP